MNQLRIACALFLATAFYANAAETDILEILRPQVSRLIAEFDQIPAERIAVLDEAAAFIRTQVEAGKPANLTFICTHNSRRSHLSQIWTQTAAAYYGIDAIHTYSGGTEFTACNIRTVRALRRAGFSVADSTGGENPVYLIQYAENREPVKAFSKVYNCGSNPQRDFAAMICCSHADQNCPVVLGAAARFPIHYVDPKASDGTELEAATYDARCHQIAREMFYLVSRAKPQA
jgi:arsenate reductase